MSGSPKDRHAPVDRPLAAPVDAILLNVVWIVDHLDRRALAELGEVPVLELAKHVSITRTRRAP
ncbi:MAG: hypothetical protein IT294_07150 [Deltaproteobacteria bacterium]|nr:hypothetical protein [Deltaproteobacteria bacterium]